MNQLCKVCGEPAAGFHFGAFTCEGCKSFFGRSYNNMSSIQECKNNGQCVIDKKNRTSCKACRLRKCLMVGMSKSGSRYGRRSNWFKIHCLLQEQANQGNPDKVLLPDDAGGHVRLRVPMPDGHHHEGRHHEEGEEYKTSTSPSVSSPESHNSDSSVEASDSRARFLSRGLGMLSSPVASHHHHHQTPSPHHHNHHHHRLLPPSIQDASFYHSKDFLSQFPLIPPLPLSLSPGFLPPGAFHNQHKFVFPSSMEMFPSPVPKADMCAKKHFLDAVLHAQKMQNPTLHHHQQHVPMGVPADDNDDDDDANEKPMDLSVKKQLPIGVVSREYTPPAESDRDEEVEPDDDDDEDRPYVKAEVRVASPLDLTCATRS